MAVLFFVVVVCAVFVGLTRLALRFPPHEMDAVLVGLALFTVPALAIYPPAALLWALCLFGAWSMTCLLYTSPSPRDRTRSRMPSSA